MERCPLCKARLKDAPLCPRCGADLTMPFRIEAQAESLLQQVIELLAKNEITTALTKVERLLTLKSTPLARILQCLLRHLEQVNEVVNYSGKIPEVIILGYQPD